MKKLDLTFIVLLIFYFVVITIFLISSNASNERSEIIISSLGCTTMDCYCRSYVSLLEISEKPALRFTDMLFGDNQVQYYEQKIRSVECVNKTQNEVLRG